MMYLSGMSAFERWMVGTARTGGCRPKEVTRRVATTAAIYVQRLRVDHALRLLVCMLGGSRKKAASMRDSAVVQKTRPKTAAMKMGTVQGKGYARNSASATITAKLPAKAGAESQQPSLLDSFPR